MQASERVFTAFFSRLRQSVTEPDVDRLYLDSSSFTDRSLMTSIASHITSRLRGRNSPLEDTFDEFSDMLPGNGDNGVVGDEISDEVSNLAPDRENEEKLRDCLRFESWRGVGELVIAC